MNTRNTRLVIRLALAGWLAAGCTFDPSGVTVDSDPVPLDAGSLQGDARMLLPDGGTCVPGCDGDQLRTCEPEERLTPCPLGCDAEAGACLARLTPSNGAGIAHPQDVTAALVIPAGTRGIIDTDTGAIEVNGESRRPAEANSIANGIGFYLISNQLAVVSATGFAVEAGATLEASGERGLIILSTGDALIQGVIDVSAGCDDQAFVHCPGPGGGAGVINNAGTPGGCAPGGNGDGAFGSSVNETGGGGGGLGTDGARGGDANVPGGAGGVVAGGQCPDATLVPLRGGSGGGAGGESAEGGDGGGGGGAIQITSFTRIAITGEADGLPVGIRASGAGGRGGELDDGGGGGGSGGAILLEAPKIELRDAVLAANGGAGGGGGGAELTDRGESGPFGDAQAQGGGSGDRRGGNGASLQGPAMDGAGGGDNTGGGGGGAGIIRLNVPESGLIIQDTTISPAHTRGDV